MTLGRLLSRLLPDDPSDRHQFRVLLVWLELIGGVIAIAGLLAGLERGWLGPAGLALGLLLVPPGLYVLARVVWAGIGLTSHGLVRTLLAGGEVPEAASFSAEEALVARGRIEEARASYESRLRSAPRSAAVRFALAALHRDHRRDFPAAERLGAAAKRRLAELKRAAPS